MGQLLELVFEARPAASAAALVAEILSLSQVTRDWDVDGERDVGSPIAQLVARMHSCATVLMAQATLPDVGVVSNVGVRVLRVGDLYDVEINVDLDDVREPGKLASGLYRYANALAAQYGVTSYFCGLEPAADEATRLFTGSNPGPVRFPDPR